MKQTMPRRLGRQIIYESPWVNLYVDRVEFPAGRIVERHHVLAFDKEAVAILVEDDAGRLLLVEAYRYVIERVQWEIPAGSIEPGESVLSAAEREVLEEGGYGTVAHRVLYSFHPIPGIGDKIHHVVHCRATGDPRSYDTNEIRSVRWFARSEVSDFVRAGGCRDGFTLTALLLWLQTNGD